MDHEINMEQAMIERERTRAKAHFSDNVHEIINLQNTCIEMILKNGIDRDSVNAIIDRCVRIRDLVYVNKKLYTETIRYGTEFENSVYDVLMMSELDRQEKALKRIYSLAENYR